MPEPVTGVVALAKAMGSTGPEGEKAAGNLLTRLLGPAVDEFAQALARSMAYRTRNFGRIAQKAEAKSRGNRDGIVNTRVAFLMLEDGSLCEDELMAEYLGGVLTAARTPTGKDDRAVTWIKTIAGLSALEARAHYLLYREWASQLKGRTDLNLGFANTARIATLDVDLHEFEQLMNPDGDMSFEEATTHAIPGLQAVGLVGGSSCGSRSEIAPDSAFEEVLRVQPSIRGCELYGWAQGLPGLVASGFTSKAQVFGTEPAIPRIQNAALPWLSRMPPPT